MDVLKGSKIVYNNDEAYRQSFNRSIRNSSIERLNHLFKSGSAASNRSLKQDKGYLESIYSNSQDPDVFCQTANKEEIDHQETVLVSPILSDPIISHQQKVKSPPSKKVLTLNKTSKQSPVGP